MSRFTPAARARLRRPQVQIGVLIPPPGKAFGQDTCSACSAPDPAEGYDRFKNSVSPPGAPGANVYTPDQYRVAQKKILTYSF